MLLPNTKYFLQQVLVIICFTILSISPSVLRAQNSVFIPYREGKQWGLCDYNGTIVIAPQFDSVRFLNSKEFDFLLLLTKKKNKTGLIINGKEVLQPIYDEVSASYKGFVKADYKNEQGKFSVLLDIYGNKIFPEPIQAVLVNERMDYRSRMVLFHVINKSGREDLAYWNDADNLLHYLLSDYYSIKLKTATERYYRIAFKKNENDPLTDEYFYLENDSLIQAAKTAQQENHRYNENTIDWVSAGSMKPIDEPMGIGDPEQMPSRAQRPAYVEPVVKKLNVDLRIENGELMAYFWGLPSKDSIPPQKIKLPKTATNIAVQRNKSVHFVHKTNEYLYNSRVYATFDSKGEKGIFAFGKEPVLFDTIAHLSFVNHRSLSFNSSFLVGEKDKKSEHMNYSLMNNNLELTFPLAFDAIIINSSHGGSDYNYWTAKQNGKYGIITPDGKTVVPLAYDTIINRKVTYEYGGNFLELKQGKKFGAFKIVNHEKNLMIPPVFDYSINDILLNYPYRGGFYAMELKNKDPKEVYIVVLQDEKGNIVGYANTEGKLYFKNK